MGVEATVRAYIQSTSQITYRCKNCKKSFEIPFYCTDGWGYWYGASICCGYKCMMAMRAKDLAKLNGEKQPQKQSYVLSIREIKDIESRIAKGQSNEVISQATKRSKSTIAKIRKRVANNGQ